MAYEQLGTATVRQLMDGLELRLKHITQGDGDTQEAARYVAGALMTEIAKRHQIEVGA